MTIEVVEIDEFARGKEILAYTPYSRVDAPLLIASVHGRWTGLEATMRGERGQRPVKADRAPTFKHGIFKIAVQDLTWQPEPYRASSV